MSWDSFKKQKRITAFKLSPVIEVYLWIYPLLIAYIHKHIYERTKDKKHLEVVLSNVHGVG